MLNSLAVKIAIACATLYAATIAVTLIIAKTKATNKEHDLHPAPQSCSAAPTLPSSSDSMRKKPAASSGKRVRGRSQ